MGDDEHDQEASVADIVSESNALNEVIAAMQRLPVASRARLLRTVATFFDVPLQATVAKPAESSSSPPFFSEDRTPAPKEFMLAKRPFSDIDRIVCLAYYLTHYRDQPHFETIDISKLNTEAAQVKLSNATVAVSNAIRAGLIVGVARGQKQISALGELYVQELPNREAAKAAIAHSRRPRRAVRRPHAAEDKPNDV